MFSSLHHGGMHYYYYYYYYYYNYYYYYYAIHNNFHNLFLIYLLANKVFMSLPVKDYLSRDTCLILLEAYTTLVTEHISVWLFFCYISFLLLVHLISLNTVKVIIFANSVEQ